MPRRGSDLPQEPANINTIQVILSHYHLHPRLRENSEMGCWIWIRIYSARTATIREALEINSISTTVEIASILNVLKVFSSLSSALDAAQGY